MEIETIGKLLIDLVRISIFDKLNNKQTLNKDQFITKFPNFEKKAATFVTITKDGNLRGCIGSLVPHVTLYEDLTSNGIKAAFEDPRFVPLSKEEFENIKIEISLISPISEVQYEKFSELRQKIKPNIHGVILKHGPYQATFLPQVWEQIPDFDMFIYNLYKKAGLDMSEQSLDSLENMPQIFIYTVEKIVES